MRDRTLLGAAELSLASMPGREPTADERARLALHVHRLVVDPAHRAALLSMLGLSRVDVLVGLLREAGGRPVRQREGSRPIGSWPGRKNPGPVLSGADRAGHGKPGTYSYHKCRCEPCCEAYRARQRQYAASRPRPVKPQKPVVHGKASTYKSGCRCEPCRVANARYRAAWKAKWRSSGSAKARQFGLAVLGPSHGKANTYSDYGCRCVPCSEAMSAYMRAYRARKREAVS